MTNVKLKTYELRSLKVAFKAFKHLKSAIFGRFQANFQAELWDLIEK